MEAFRWTATVGLQGIGFLSMSNPDSEAAAVSADGSVIAGTSKNADGDRGFRWTSGGGMLALGTFGCSSCDPSTGANGISGNGLVAVVGAGLSKSLFGDPDPRLGALDRRRNLDQRPGRPERAGHVLGRVRRLPDRQHHRGSGRQQRRQPGLVVGTGRMHALSGVAGAQIRSGAMAISSDAGTVVGFANTSATGTGTLEAVRWTGASFGTVEVLGRSSPGPRRPPATRWP